MIAVQGSIQVRPYEDKNGNKRTATEVIVEKASFCGEKKQEEPKEVNIDIDDNPFADFPF